MLLLSIDSELADIIEKEALKIRVWNISKSITSITDLMSQLRSLVKVERSSLQRKVRDGLELLKFQTRKQ